MLLLRKAIQLISTARGEIGSHVIHIATKADRDSAVILTSLNVRWWIKMVLKLKLRLAAMLSVIVSIDFSFE